MISGGAIYRRLKPYFLGGAGFVLFIIVWQALSSDSGAIARIPSPASTASAWLGMLQEGVLGSAIVASTIRILVGASLASLVGIGLGSLAGTQRLFDRTVTPVHRFFRYIPPTAFIPVLIFFFGIGEGFQYAVVFFSIYFFIYQMTVDAYRDIDERFVNMAVVDGYSGYRLFRHILLPSVGPRLLDLVRLNVAAAWTFLVASEMIGASNGLGRLIVTAQRFGEVENMFAVLFTFGLIGLLLDILFALAFIALFRWRLSDEQ